MSITPIFEKKNVLVTGGAGFIGSHLCESLLKKNKVICVDNFLNSSPSNIESLLKDPNFEFIKLDINEPFKLEDYPELDRFKIKFQGVQEMYHLACPTSAKNFSQYKKETLLANSVGIYHILELALRHKAKVLLASSSVVYGKRGEGQERFSEQEVGVLDHLGQRSCYDEGKRFAETMFSTYAQIFKLDTKIARIFRTYGPRLKLFDGQMMSDFIVDAIHDRNLVIYGDENFSSSLVYVTDIVDGLIRLMAASPDIGPINLGDDRSYRMFDIAELIIKMTGSKSKIIFEQPLEFITPLGLPDISKAKEQLGWFPLVSLNDGLLKLIDYTVAYEKKIIAH